MFALNARQSLYNSPADDKNSSEFSNISSDNNEMFEKIAVMNKEEAEEIINKLKKNSKKTTCLYRKFNNSDQVDKSSEKSSLNESCQILESEKSDLDNERCQDAEIIEYKDIKYIENTIKRIKI
ncbi:hypothetical protein C2G38_2198236 [Gigaspora rosea]|uniref:Uncharacterized protein n=1 Tax=Gigaspora rosea TaxID=44941 RepID=A0A397V091_9GLOM|nr:hypothetical protein C2G38_2198236 [Gigaspora rosea]CAG8597251.1 309_t:CDS:2 [Gigaspora rosea]